MVEDGRHVGFPRIGRRRQVKNRQGRNQAGRKKVLERLTYCREQSGTGRVKIRGLNAAQIGKRVADLTDLEAWRRQSGDELKKTGGCHRDHIKTPQKTPQ